MSQKTFDRLEEELNHLRKIERVNIIQEIAEARSNGDLSENAEYHAAREKQGEIEHNIQTLEDKVSRAEIITASANDSEHIIFGAKVTVLDKTRNKEITYTLVSPEGMNVLENKISIQSPIGKGLLGKKVGDTAEIQIPKGTLSLEILSFE